MSTYIYSGLHTGESEAYLAALDDYLEVFASCPSGDYAPTGSSTPAELERISNIAINPTGSGYAVYNGTANGTGWYEVRITPSLNPDYSPIVVGIGCTRAEANNDFLLVSGEASQGSTSCPICLSSGSMSQSGVFQTPIEATYLLDFKWEIELIVHEYDQIGYPPITNWCADGSGDPECSNWECPSFAILSGWTAISSGTETSIEMKDDHLGAIGSYLWAYTGFVPGFTAGGVVYPDVQLGFGDYLGGGSVGDGHDKWELTVHYGGIPTVDNNVWKWIGVNEVSSAYYSGSYENCLEPTNTGVPTAGLVECYAAEHSLSHPSNSSYYTSNTWRFKVTEASVSRLGDNGSQIFPNPDIHHFATSGEFSSPSICDVYKYFHYYDCVDVQWIQDGSSLDNCQVLEALEAAPESGMRVKMPCTSWDWMMTGSFWSRPASSLSGSCTVSSLGSGVSLAYASFGDGMCGALVMRNDDSGDWAEIDGSSSIGHWSGLTYIDNQGCSGCSAPTESGYNPEPGIFSGCSGYNACVDVSGHYAGC
jgi:hypothetical protein